MDHFIDTVRRYPCLWNTTAIEYRDQELKDAAWAEVMKETDLSSVKEVKLKWKKLRDSYRDALKRQSETLAKEPGGGGTGKKAYPWKYMRQMQFLQPYMSNRKKAGECGGAGEPAPPPAPRARARSCSSSCSSADSEEERKERARLSAVDRELFEGGAGARRKRPPPPPPPDPLDIFFNGMCQSTKRFPFHAQIEIKKTLFGAVIAAEEALLAHHQHQSYAGLWSRAGAAPRAPSDSSSGTDAPRRRL